MVAMASCRFRLNVRQIAGRTDAKIVAVADPDPARRAAVAAELGCAAYASLGRLLAAEPGAEVVVLATPTHLHARQAREVLKAGRHAVVEKPFATTLRQADAVLAAEAASDGMLFVHQNYRFHPDFVYLRRVISAGDAEDHCKVLLLTEGGPSADLEFSDAQNLSVAPPRWVVAGRYGTLTCDRETATLRWLDPPRLPPLEVENVAAAVSGFAVDEDFRWQEETETVPPASQGFYDNVIGVIRRGEDRVVTPESAREMTRVISLIRGGTPFA